jgi:uncharacterized protein YyaL (SSP411 family)
MLYDNAALLGLLTEVWQETRLPLFATRIAETIGWREREMLTAPDAAGDRAFAATLDADSEGVEGKFYVWDEAEIDTLLGADAPLFKRFYDVKPGGNWEGHTVLNRRGTIDQPTAQEEETLTLLRGRLLAARGKRMRPGWDDKVLADWNGMMIVSLAHAALAFDRPNWLALAVSAYRFIQRNLRAAGKAGDGLKLHHAWRAGKKGAGAMLDDYAELACAALALHEATGEDRYRDDAEQLAAVRERHFWDPENHGYFATADDVGDVILRTKSAGDNATPSGNAIMVEVFSRLYHLTGNPLHARRLMQVVTAFSGEIHRNFFPLATFLNAVDYHLNCLQLVLVGRRDEAGAAAQLKIIQEQSLPTKLLQVVAPGASLPAQHPAAGKGQVDGRATIYICRGQTCGLPVTDGDTLRRALSEQAI